VSAPAGADAGPGTKDADVLADFVAGYPFGLDDFQLEACRALLADEGVLVAAPTGAGKTVVGEFAVHLALSEGRKCFYTTPIKALSNQKYADLVERYGQDSIGLLTGDTARNGDAPVVVMTTEVLRNMLYGGSSALIGLGYVVMDEVHYLSDRFRGAVWEEVIIHLPDSVRLVSLSATVSNAEEFAQWLVTVRGDTRVIVSEHRPVPLWQHVAIGHRLVDLFTDDGEVNPHLIRLAREAERFQPGQGGGPRRGREAGRNRGGAGNQGRVRRYHLDRADLITRLDREGLLPAITFIFSRVGCDAAVRQCVAGGLRLVGAEERAEIRRRVEKRTSELDDGDLRVLGYYEWLDGLERGLAAHHAGMLPLFKEVVEELFAAGLIRAVFATETLALGINMPARSVVLEKLVKWNGETHADVTAGEYTQLTGRAGRRGIDVEGHAVVAWQPGLDVESVAGLASTRTYPLRSSFRPSYNMTVNLVGQVGRERARSLLESSFAQFQADRAVVGLTRRIQRNTEALDGYLEAMTCHLGDIESYEKLRQQIRDRESSLAKQGASQRRLAATEALEALRPGDVIRVPAGRRSGLAVVLDNGVGQSDGPRPTVLTADRQIKRLSMIDFPTAVSALAHVRVPRAFNPRSPQSRRDLAATLHNIDLPPESPQRRHRSRAAAADDETLHDLRRALRAHPVHGCADREDHLRWADRWNRLRRDTDTLQGRVAGRTNVLARTFDRVCGLLTELGYLHADTVTPEGRRLARIYSEADLLVAECLRREVWSGLTAPQLAAAASALIYENRRDDGPGSPRLPTVGVQEAVAETVRLWSELHELEEQHRLNFLTPPDAGFAAATFRWASGMSLDAVLDDDLTAGDFVRWTRQLIDLLDQIAAASQDEVARTAREAVSGLRRGVVAQTPSRPVEALAGVPASAD
jgi:ATP-dependent RNA helicase HelY